MSSDYTAMPPPSQRGESGSDEEPYIPTSVKNAVGLMYFIVVLGLLSIVAILASRTQLTQAIHDSDKSLTPSQIDDRADTATVITIVVAAIIAILYVLLALQVRKGKNWARIVTLVVSPLGIVVLVIRLFQPASLLLKIVQGTEVAMFMLIVLLLLGSASSAYFDRGRE